jgi:hypothetical protein
VNFDRTLVINYAQWTSRAAIAGARESPKVVALVREQVKIADSLTPIQYELRNSMTPAGS